MNRKTSTSNKIFHLFLAVGFMFVFNHTCMSQEVSFSADSVLYRAHTTEKSIAHLLKRFGAQYEDGGNHLIELAKLKAQYQLLKNQNDLKGMSETAAKLTSLQRRALLNSPIIDFDELLFVKRKIDRKRWDKMNWNAAWSNGSMLLSLGIYGNHSCVTSVSHQKFKNELSVLNLNKQTDRITTLLDQGSGNYIGMMNLHWDANKILYTHQDSVNWKVMELDLNSRQSRQVSQTPTEINSFDPTYLPNGKIIFGSTANFQSIPCFHGTQEVSNLYLMKDDGSEMRRLCFDQDNDHHPTVLSSGQIMYNRWDYTGINHVFNRILMAMNPDGTGQRAIYGSNSWFPNSIYHQKEVPGGSKKLIAISSGYHGDAKAGMLLVIDPALGWKETNGVVKRISGRGDSLNPIYRDRATLNIWPKFTTPFPIDENYFLVSCWKEKGDNIGIYLADAFDNLVLIEELEGYALLEPIPVKKRKTPPNILDRTDLSKNTATAYIQNIYAGEGLKGVPKGSVDRIRVLAYNYGNIGLAGPNKIGYGGPWEAMQIVGTVPVEEDGSVMFEIPANTPIAFQPIDDEGKALQLMRTWTSAMPGEVMSCVGCHESPQESIAPHITMAAKKAPKPLDLWYGKPRGFDFEREVQPVIDRKCISCHHGEQNKTLDLRGEAFFPDYKGLKLTGTPYKRLADTIMAQTDGYWKYTPSYDVLLPYVRRVAVESTMELLNPAELGANTSPLVQLLKSDHYGVKLNKEEWERLYTWIDLNAPSHGTWNDMIEVPNGVAHKRKAYNQQYGAAPWDFEYISEKAIIGNDPDIDDSPYVLSDELKNYLKNLQYPESSIAKQQGKLEHQEKEILLNNGVGLQLVQVPGNSNGDTQIEPFWISSFEITNEQFRAFKKEHNSGIYDKRIDSLGQTWKLSDGTLRKDARGLTLNMDKQPATRISYNEANAFCTWLSEKTGMKISLPTETQWSYVCVNGNKKDPEYSNLADKSFATKYQETGGIEHLSKDGADLADTTIFDHQIVTAYVGTFKPSLWGIYDLYGNVNEWVKSSSVKDGYAIAKGGSFFDPPNRVDVKSNVTYPTWQKVFNVGFRVVVYEEDK
jgi:hypothetical protein